MYTFVKRTTHWVIYQISRYVCAVRCSYRDLQVSPILKLFVHVLLYDLFVYCLYLKILPSFNLNSLPLSCDHVFHYVLYIEVLFRGHMAITNKRFLLLLLLLLL